MLSSTDKSLFFFVYYLCLIISTLFKYGLILQMFIVVACNILVIKVCVYLYICEHICSDFNHAYSVNVQGSIQSKFGAYFGIVHKHKFNKTGPFAKFLLIKKTTSQNFS